MTTVLVPLVPEGGLAATLANLLLIVGMVSLLGCGFYNMVAALEIPFLSPGRPGWVINLAWLLTAGALLTGASFAISSVSETNNAYRAQVDQAFTRDLNATVETGTDVMAKQALDYKFTEAEQLATFRIDGKAVLCKVIVADRGTENNTLNVSCLSEKDPAAPAK